MSPSPIASVVVATAGRVALTGACLESVKAVSTVDGVPVEIVVVDSSSMPDQTALRNLCAHSGVELLQGPESVSVKRNLGAEHARTDLVLFVDSDCTLAPGCLAAHLAALDDPEIHGSQGRILFRGSESLAFRAIRSSGLLNAFDPAKGHEVRSVASGNLMIRRGPLMQVGFDARLGPPGFGGEDVDCGMRLSEAGFRIIGTPDATVYHDTTTWNAVSSNLGRFFSWGRSEAHLIERHPALAYLDMPSPVLVALLLATTALAAAVCNSPRALLAFPAGFVTFILAMSLAGARRHCEDPLAGSMAYWVFFVLDLGRVFEALRRGRPGAACRRLQFTEHQMTEEWPDLVATSWAVWLMVLVGVCAMWWAVA